MTHIGHALPDDDGVDQYYANLVCVAGEPIGSSKMLRMVDKSALTDSEALLANLGISSDHLPLKLFLLGVAGFIADGLFFYFVVRKCLWKWWKRDKRSN